MARQRIELNHSGMASMLKSDAVRSELRRRAEAVAAAARQRAPVDTGAYRDSIVVKEGTSDRARAYVVADDPKAAVIESQSRVLGSSIDAGRG